MKVTIELSLYPLQEDYTGIIIDFINGLKAREGLTVRTTSMSTYISGDYDHVMSVVNSALKHVHTKIPDSAPVMKIIPKDLNIEDGYLEF